MKLINPKGIWNCSNLSWACITVALQLFFKNLRSRWIRLTIHASPPPKVLINYPVKLTLNEFEPCSILWRVDIHIIWTRSNFFFSIKWTLKRAVHIGKINFFFVRVKYFFKKLSYIFLKLYIILTILSPFKRM